LIFISNDFLFHSNTYDILSSSISLKIYIFQSLNKKMSENSWPDIKNLNIEIITNRTVNDQVFPKPKQ